jgi:hypothetical protein
VERIQREGGGVSVVEERERGSMQHHVRVVLVSGNGIAFWLWWRCSVVKGLRLGACRDCDAKDMYDHDLGEWDFRADEKKLQLLFTLKFSELLAQTLQ